MSKYPYNGPKNWMKFFYKIIAVIHHFLGNILEVQQGLCVIIQVKLCLSSNYYTNKSSHEK